MVRIAVSGASGRMGRLLIEAIDAASDLVLSGALDRADSPSIGTSVAGVPVTTDVRDALSRSDVLIDFTQPAATLVHIALCRESGVKMVIGTTGFDAAGKATIAAAAAETAIVFSPNMSIGVNVMFKLVADATRALATGYDIEIVEAHHRNKVDAPSGTALKLGEIAAEAIDRDLSAVAVHGREGRVGVRPPSSIGFSAIRGGDIVGDHTVLYAGAGERIEITHRASSREGYTSGSLLAARFVARHGTGLFDMQDVLGFR